MTNSRNARDGRFVERIGFFNPVATGGEVRLSVDQERATYWLGQGAQPSERVAQLLRTLPRQTPTAVMSEMPTPADDLVVIGKIVSVYGIRGE